MINKIKQLFQKGWKVESHGGLLMIRHPAWLDSINVRCDIIDIFYEPGPKLQVSGRGKKIIIRPLSRKGKKLPTIGIKLLVPVADNEYQWSSHTTVIYDR